MPKRRAVLSNLDGQGRAVTTPEFDLAAYERRFTELAERRWREVWAPKYGLDPALSGRARAIAMAQATGLMAMIPREPGEDREEDKYR
jgi:hypothetical protein